MSTPKPKLTKEEKQARKIKFMLDKKHAAEEKKKQDIRDFLNREQKFTKSSREILDNHWEHICGQLTLCDLRTDLNCKRQNLIKCLDTKESLIEQLRRWRDEATIQHKRLFEGHVNTLEYLTSEYLNIYRLSRSKLFFIKKRNL